MLALSGCGTSLIRDKKIDYKKSSSVPSLEVPPELVLERDTTLQVPEARSVRYSEYDRKERKAAQSATPAASPVLSQPDAKIRFYRRGDTHWLTVAGEPAQVWPQIKQFWLNLGFEFIREDARVGVLETDWKENRANIPDDIVRRTIGQVLDFAYDSLTRDMYRTRLEHGEQAGTTEIYITHKGLHQVSQDGNFEWVARPSEVDLEAEMLKRLMLSLGSTGEQPGTASTEIRPETVMEDAQIRLVQGEDGHTRIEMPGNFPEVWRRTGLALDHGGFTVEDRDRTKGDYYVRYIGKVKAEESGVLSKLAFWRDDETEQKIVYVVHVSRDEQHSSISLSRQDDVEVEAERRQRILEILLEHLR